MANLTDITDLTDDALDVFLAVKAGDDCVAVEHLNPAERLSVCRALGIDAPHYWISGAPYASEVPRRRVGGIDHEAMILDRQELEELA